MVSQRYRHPGATNNTYTVSLNANYKVAVTNGYGCADTSEVFGVTNIGVNDWRVTADLIQFTPNPAKTEIFIHSPVALQVRITDMMGRIVHDQQYGEHVTISTLTQGSYLIHFLDEKGVLLKVDKLVKIE